MDGIKWYHAPLLAVAWLVMAVANGASKCWFSLVDLLGKRKK